MSIEQLENAIFKLFKTNMLTFKVDKCVMWSHTLSSVSIFLRFLFTQQGEQLARGIGVVVIPLALLSEGDETQQRPD